MEVVLFAFDGAFGTGAGVFVEVPEVATSGDEGVEAIVHLGVGVDDAAIGRVRAVGGEVGQEVRTGVFLAAAKGQRHLRRKRSGQKPQRFMAKPARQMGMPFSRRRGPA
jgi:hypothetical protein